MASACDRCGGPLDELRVCISCGRHAPLSAPERIAQLCDAFDEQDAHLVGDDPLGFDDYLNAVYAARVETSLNEAAVWGWAEFGGVRCALVVLDFRFLGGSMGVAVGEKVARAFDAARAERAPVVAVTASGGARMQEGMAALVQMAKTTEARRLHAESGLAQVTLIASPTTGGVYASFASLGDVLYAEPEAHVGFAGPRVVQILTGSVPPPEVHTAEFALLHGMIDAIVPRADQRRTIAVAVRSLSGARGDPHHAPRSLDAAVIHDAPESAWDRLQLARDPERPHAPRILDVLLDEAIELRGDRTGADDAFVLVRLGALHATGVPIVAIGQVAGPDPSRIGPEGFRKAARALRMAARLGLPVVTLIDTRGAEPGPDAEAAGVAASIATCMEAMLACRSPTLAVVIGEGGSGGALAMAAADRVLAWENAVFSVIAPTGAASILYRDASRAPEIADRLGITARDLVRLGIVDEVLPEPDGGAQADPQGAMSALGERIASELDRLAATDAAERLSARSTRWRQSAAQWLRYV